MFRYILLLLLLSFAVACGGSDKPDSSGGGTDATAEDDDEEEVVGRKTYSPDKGTATVMGVVKFEGKARRRTIDMGSEKYCVNCYEDGAKPKTESAIVGENGELANVFVQIKGGLKGWKFPKGTGEKLIDQIKCRYEPHVLGMQVGETLKIRNSDPIMHNIHATDTASGDDYFNQGQPNKGDVFERNVARAGMFKLKCDVHGWMGASICVVKHPFYTVTGTDGSFSISKLPAGTYEVEAWHEKFGTSKQSVTVEDGKTATINFTFKK
ncbi:MAG: carboxypeptidase regulatory-like domain-containing protein [Planctomycetota bacterium]|jgi:plastocyanin